LEAVMNGKASVPQKYRSEVWLIREAQSGDRRATEYLLTQHPSVLALLASLRRNIDPFNLAPADLQSAGRLALLEALQRFDPERGVKFATYAYHFVRGAMLAELYPHVERRRERENGSERVRVVSLVGHATDRADGNDGYESELLARDPDYGADPGFASVEDIRPAAVRAFVEGLPVSQREIVEAVYWDERTHDEIAAERGVSRPAISRALARVYARGARELANHRLELAA
jgi:RNA polymerase sigma factor (sigma-70 family)